jgi:dTDP-4-dehydrorhamnose reductase
MSENLTTDPTLITGASGFLGWNLLQTAPKDINILAQYHHNQPNLLPNHNRLQLDLSKTNAIQTFKDFKFSAIIYAAAYSDIRTCQQDPKASKIVNLDLPLHLSEISFQKNLPFIYYSTDLIFDGCEGNYLETSSPNPLSLYGEQKAAAEQAILKNNPNALILRCPLMYGEANPNRPATLQNSLSQLHTDETQTLFTDEYRSAARALRIAQFTWKSLGALNGLYNVGGQEALSRYEMGMKLAKVYQIDKPAIKAIRQSDLPQLGPRPANCTLNSQKARSKGFLSLTYLEELQHIKEISHDQK